MLKQRFVPAELVFSSNKMSVVSFRWPLSQVQRYFRMREMLHRRNRVMDKLHRIFSLQQGRSLVQIVNQQIVLFDDICRRKSVHWKFPNRISVPILTMKIEKFRKIDVDFRHSVQSHQRRLQHFDAGHNCIRGSFVLYPVDSTRGVASPEGKYI